MEHFDLLFTQVNDIGEVQQQMKTQMDIGGQALDHYTAEQHLIAQQVKANGAAIAQLTMRQFDNDGPFEDDSSVSVIFYEKEDFENVFAKNKGTHKGESSKTRKPPPKHDKKNTLPKLCPRCNFQSLMAKTQDLER
jgi:hypothetical protein